MTCAEFQTAPENTRSICFIVYDCCYFGACIHSLRKFIRKTTLPYSCTLFTIQNINWAEPQPHQINIYIQL